MIILQILRYFLLLPIAVFGSLVAILFAPVICLFCDTKGFLPSWLKWFEPNDTANGCLDTLWVQSHPDWSDYHCAWTFIQRNPFYGGLQWLRASKVDTISVYGNPYCDSSNSLGACLRIDLNGAFQFDAVYKFPLVSWCVIHSFGWNIKATGKTSGAYILAPIRFYTYTGK